MSSPSAQLDSATAATSGGRRAGRLVAAILCAAMALVAVTVALAVVTRGEGAKGELPVLGTLPSFTLTSERGLPFGSADLRGKAWVANFIFTRCPTVCPLLTRKMASLQPRARELEDTLHLVSFSVDPEHDTPEVLRAYSEKNGADPSRWTFLTGAPDAIRATVVEGLRTSLGREGPAENVAGIFHGTHFVLVDGEGRIRGYYGSEEPDSLEKLARDMIALARSGSTR